MGRLEIVSLLRYTDCGDSRTVLAEILIHMVRVSKTKFQVQAGEGGSVHVYVIIDNPESCFLCTNDYGDNRIRHTA